MVKRATIIQRLLAPTLAVLCFAVAAGAQAQDAQPAMAQPIDASQLSPEQRAMMGRAMRNGGGHMPGMQAAQAQPEGEKPKSDGDKPAEEKPAEEAATVKRSEDGSANPDELKAKPDDAGMVQFSFRNQPWPDVLQWFADVAECSLDWQELPADKLNLITKRRHSLEQTRDLLNRYLLARGFTMLRQGDVLTVVKLDKIDPALVPRVEPDDLEDHLPYDFARVRFKLPEAMDPAKAVEDVKVLLNPTAKVTPLLASRQLMVIDAVANLRDVRDLVYGEQMAADDDIRPALFPIRHRRADYIADQIMIVLGMDPQSRKSPMELQLEQQRMQLLMQMQGSGKDVTQMLRQDGPPVFVAVDRRRNTVSVNAPPKEMAIIERVVKQFDVPSVGGLASESDLMGDELTTKRYQTVAVSPDAIVTALKEIANLSPLTQLQSDEDSKTIFANATAADHETIKAMIAKLDGTGRELRVIWLSRRSPADQIAGTIQALMVGEKKEENNNRRGYYFFDYYGGNRNNDEDNKAGFRIQADVENNRLIVMATDDEYKEVTEMLKELGVVTSQRGGNPTTFRVLDARTPEETADLVERLRQAWGGRNPLNINVAPPAQSAPPAQQAPAGQAPADAAGAEEDAANSDAVGEAAPLDTTTGVGPRGVRAVRSPFRLAQYSDEAGEETEVAVGDDVVVEPTFDDDEQGAADEEASDEDEAASPAAPPAAINLTVTPDGRIVISSEDPMALDQFEELLSELAPPQRDFKVYELENTDCLDVWYNLKDYFAEELAEETSDFDRWWYGSDDEEEQPATLGRRRKLRFIYDTATNTILVQNASPAQIQTIDNLVKIYDQAPSEDSVRQRRTAIIQVKFSRAQDIATAIKEVYRDLLSSKDKEFQQRDGNQRGGGGRREIVYRFPGSDDKNKKTPGVKMAFEGALSIGVDTLSNTLVVSAEESIFESVQKIISDLDEQARPDTIVQVHRITGSLDAEELQQALSTALTRPWSGGNPATAGNQQDGDRGENRDGGDRRRNRDGGRNRGGDNDGD